VPINGDPTTTIQPPKATGSAARTYSRDLKLAESRGRTDPKQEEHERMLTRFWGHLVV
jgi:hypothetical protein